MSITDSNFVYTVLSTADKTLAIKGLNTTTYSTSSPNWPTFPTIPSVYAGTNTLYNGNGISANAYKIVEISDYAFVDKTLFAETTLSSTFLGPNLTKIGDGAFQGVKLKGELVIPQNIMSVGFKTFYNCTLITKITIGSETNSDIVAHLADLTAAINQEITDRKNADDSLNLLKAPIDTPTFTGTATIPNASITNATISSATITNASIAVATITSASISTLNVGTATFTGSASVTGQWNYTVQPQLNGSVMTTEGYVNDKFSAILGGSLSSTLDTLSEIANAISNDPSFATTVTTGHISLSNAISKEVSDRVVAVASVSSGLSSAVSTLTAADTSLTGALAAEVGTRTSAVASHSSALSSAVSTLNAADTSLTGALAAEVGTRTSAVASHSSALSSAVSTLNAADTSLTGALAAEVGTRTSAVASHSSALSSAVSTLNAADTSLTGALAAEVGTRTSAVASHSSALSSAVSTLNAADTSLTGALAAEVGTRTSAVASHSSALSSAVSSIQVTDNFFSIALVNEISTRTGSVASVSSALSSAVSTLTAADTSLTASITNEVASRVAAVASLSTSVSSAVSTLTSANSVQSSALSNEIVTRISQVASISTLMTASVASLTTANATITTAITSEVINRSSAISTAISNIIGGAPSAFDTLSEIASELQNNPSLSLTTSVLNQVVSMASAISSEVVARSNSVVSLSSALSSAVSSLVVVDTSLTGALTAEVGTRTSAVVSLSGALSSTVSTLTVADTSLSSALVAEVGTRSSAVVSLSSALSSAVSSLVVVDTTLTSAIAAEVTTRSGSVVSVSTTLYNAVSSTTLVNLAQATALATEVTTRLSAVSSISTAFFNASTAFQTADTTLSTSIVSLTTQVALKANKTYLDSVISQVIGNAPTNLDTLYEIAAALNNNNNFAGSITTVLASKADTAAVNSLVSTLSTKATHSELVSLSTVVGTKADTSTVSTMQISVNNLTNSKDILVGQVSTLITTGGNVNSSNVGVNGVTLTDLANRAQELYYKFGYVNGDGTINYKINRMSTPTLVTSWLEFVLDANNDITAINHKATVQFDKYQTNVQYSVLNAVNTINNISLTSNFQHTFTATYTGGTTYYIQNSGNMVITALESPIRMAPTDPTLTIAPPELGSMLMVTQSGQSVSFFVWNPLYKQYLLTRSEYAATTWSDATGLISQPLTIQTDSGSVLKFDTGTHSGVTIELFSGATLVSDKTFSTTGASSTYLVKYAPSVVKPPGIISVSYSTNYISFTLEQSVYDDLLSNTKFLYISAAQMAIETPYQAAFTDLPIVYWMSPSYATSSATPLQSRTQSFVVTPTTTVLGKRLRFNNNARSVGSLQNQYYWDNRVQYVDISATGTVLNHVGAISVRVLNSTTKIGSDPLTIANVFNDYAQYAAPTMVANSKTVSKSGAAYTYTATFTNANGAAMQVLNADNSVASAQPTVNVAYSYPTTYDSSKIGQPIFKINVPTSGSKRASTYLVINGEDIAPYAAPVLSGSVTYASVSADSRTATATYTFNANVSAVKVMNSDGSTIIASHAVVTSGTATLVIPHTTADISGSKSFHVIALGNNLGTDSAASVSQPFMVPMVAVSTDTNVALKMLSKIQGPPTPNMHSRGVAVNRTTGNIYVVDNNNHRILAFNRTGNFMFKLGTETAGTANGQFNNPYGIAVDTFGNIYVADTGNHRIQIFDSTGRFMFKFGTGTSGTANGEFSSPHGIAVDTAGNIYVADLGNHRVQVFDSVGTFLFKIGNATNAAGSADGEFNNPCGITIDPENNIIVTEITNNRIQVFNSTGTFMCKFGSLGAGTANLNGPQGVAVDNTGKILVSDTDNGRIQVLSRTGNTISYVRTISSFGTNDSQLSSNRGIAVNADNDIIVANPNNGTVKIFKNDGTFLFKIAEPVALGNNGGVAIDILNDTIWAVDSTANAIKKFTSTGMLVSQFGTNGTGNGQFNGPTSIAVHMQTGNICVADTDNSRIQVFGSAGNHIRSFGSSGSGDGYFQLPRGIATDSAGNIYVADTGNNRIQKFNSQGEFVSKLGNLYGSATGEFAIPYGVAVDAVGNIYVADTNNNRIQVFTSAGIHIRSFGSNGTANGKFEGPRGIAIDIAGNIIVADIGNHRVQMFTNAGMHIRSFGSNGTGNGQFAYPAGLALNASGHIVVADNQNYRIQIIGPTPDLELDANNGVTVKFIGNSSTVLSTAPKFVYANPRGTGSEWFAVVDNSANAKTMIRNYANNFSNPTALAMSTGGYFTNGANGLVAFNNIVTTLMTDMSNLFNPDGFTSPNASGFNQPIASWDTSNVTTFLSMFEGATAFNQPIGSWDTSKVTQMSNMFYNANAFNHYIGSWNTINVYGMSGTFRGASAFNKPIGLWNTINVVNMNAMFAYTTYFNQPIGSWNTINVGNMDGMFAHAPAFNKNISKWNVANLTRNPPLNFNSGGIISIANLPTWAPELSNFVVGTKSLGDVAFTLPEPTSTITPTYGSILGESFTPASNASYANNTIISADGTMLGLSVPSSTGTIRMYSYAAPATYIMNAISAGISRTPRTDGNLLGIADGKKGTMSIWCNFTDASTNQNIWLSRDNWGIGDTVYMQSNNGYVRLVGKSSQNTDVLFATTSTQPCNVSGTWYHIFASWDMNVLNRVNVWVNGVAQTLTIATFVTGGTIHYDATNHGIGLTLYDPILPTNLGLVGQVYVNFSEYVDPATSIGKFYDTQNKRPIYLGANGAIPTGNSPIVHLDFASTYSSTTIVNSGTGGNFVSYNLPTSTTPVKIEWVQRGGDIVGPSGSWSGTNGKSTFPFAFAMSADGKTLAVGESGLGNSSPGTVSIYKYDSTKTNPQLTQGLPNYGPIGWSRITQLSGSGTIGFGYLVAMSADAKTLAVSAVAVNTITVYAWDGTNWTTKGSKIIGPYASNYSITALSISANGQRIMASSNTSLFNDIGCIYADWTTNEWLITYASAVIPVQTTAAWNITMSADKRSAVLNTTGGNGFSVYKQNETTGVWALVGSAVAISNEVGPITSTSINADGTMVSITLSVTRNGRYGSAWVYRFNGTNWVNVCVIPNRIAQNSNLAFNAMVSADGSRLAVGGLGMVSVYDLITAGKITYTSSIIATAEVYGNLVLMKALGTSTITASQTSASGTGTITSTLTVIPQFAAPVLSNKVFALTATPGSHTFTATCTVDAAVAQVKIIKAGTADTTLAVSGGSVSISVSYATADISTSFYVVAVGNATGGTSNYTSQAFLDPPPVLSNFVVGTKFLADSTFVLPEPTSTMQISYTSNSITTVGQSFTGLTTALAVSQTLVKISADGTTIGIVIGTSTGTVRMHKLIGNVWTQIGGDITGTANGQYAGVSRFEYYNNRSIGTGSFSMSADGTLLTTVQTGLGSFVGLLNIYKYDPTKTTAQTTNAALSTYGPAYWSRVATMSLTTTTPTVVLSADGKTIAVSDNTLRMYSSADGGTTWTPKGEPITDPSYTSWFYRSISISANGSAVVAAPTRDAFDAAQFNCYEWNGTTWDASSIRAFSRGAHTNSGTISADGKVCVIQNENFIHRYTKVSGAWTLARSVNVFQSTFGISTSADGTFILLCREGGSPPHGTTDILRWNGTTYVYVINNNTSDTIENRTTDLMQFNSMLSSDGTRVVVGGKGKVDVYDLVATSKTAYTSSNPAVAEVHGNLVLMKAVGTSTITASQTSASGTGTITSTLTVIPQFAAPVLSNKVFALTATPGSHTFTATCTVDAAVAQVKIIKAGTADTTLAVSGGSVSISVSYATADISTSFYVVAVGNATGGTSNYTSQAFLDPPPVLSNFVVGTKFLADSTFVLPEPTSTMQISYTSNSITTVGQSFTGLTTALAVSQTLVKISADGTTIGIVIGTSTGTVRMHKLIGNVWTQIGGDITGTANGRYAGVGLFYAHAVGWFAGNNTFSMSADGKLLTTVETGLGSFAGLLNVYKYDVNKTTAQTTNAALSTYGPINWSRVSTMQLLTQAPNVVLSADGKTMAVSDRTLRMYRSDDGGTTWTPRGETITDTDPLYNYGYFHPIGISASGLAVLAAPTRQSGNAAKYMCYEWNGTTWDASLVCNFSWVSSAANSCAISADGKVCIIHIGPNVSRYTKNVSGVWTLAHNLSLNSDVYYITTSADGNFISFGRVGSSGTYGDVEIHRWNGSAYVAVINNRTIQNRTTDSMQFNSMLSSDGTRLVMGGNGKVDVCDLVATGKTAYTSSDPAVASVHGRIALMNSVGTSTITATQTNGSGSGTISSTLTVVAWTLRNAIAGYSFRSVAYGNGTWVAVAPSGVGNDKVMTSIDGGVNWTSVSVSGSTNYLMSVAYGNGSNGAMFVAVSDYGTGNRVWTSPDGVTWTNGNSAADNNWISVAYGNGLWVAVSASGVGNRVMTSPDGVLWTSRTSAVDNNWVSVAYGNGLWVAVSNTGTGNRVMTSSDGGSTWTPRSAADNGWQSVAYGNGLWVAVANNGTERLMTSSDGSTWTPRTTPGNVAQNSWSSVAYGNGLWVAISSNGSRRVMTSPDGIAWTSEISAGDYSWSSVAYSDGTWVVVSSGDGKVMTSVLTVLPPAIERADTVSSGTLSTLSTFGSQGSSNGQFNTPYAVATDAAGNIYAVDTNYHRVQVFTSAGGHIRSFGSNGTANGQFMYPSGIAINAIGNIYVADTYNHRVQVFTSAGGHIRSFGSQGSDNGQFIFPRGIAIDATGNIYVTDSNNHRVQVFTSAGGHIRSFGSQGSDNGQFEYPFGIAINAIGNILVSDTQNRIQVFSSIGEYISKFGTGGVTNGQFDSPRGIAIDATGNIYVADANNKRIQSFTSAGQHIRSFGTSGTGTGQFNNPFGIAIASGKIVVADTANHRIQIVGTT